jgi:hypothetical protein
MSETYGEQEHPHGESERPDVRDAMATFAAEGQGDDETGGDAAAGAATDPGASPGEDDREPHGPS